MTEGVRGQNREARERTETETERKRWDARLNTVKSRAKGQKADGNKGNKDDYKKRSRY